MINDLKQPKRKECLIGLSEEYLKKSGSYLWLMRPANKIVTYHDGYVFDDKDCVYDINCKDCNKLFIVMLIMKLLTGFLTIRII